MRCRKEGRKEGEKARKQNRPFGEVKNVLIIFIKATESTMEEESGKKILILEQISLTVAEIFQLSQTQFLE